MHVSELNGAAHVAVIRAELILAYGARVAWYDAESTSICIADESVMVRLAPPRKGNLPILRYATPCSIQTTEGNHSEPIAVGSALIEPVRCRVIALLDAEAAAIAMAELDICALMAAVCGEQQPLRWFYIVAFVARCRRIGVRRSGTTAVTPAGANAHDRERLCGAAARSRSRYEPDVRDDVKSQFRWRCLPGQRRAENDGQTERCDGAPGMGHVSRPASLDTDSVESGLRLQPIPGQPPLDFLVKALADFT